MSKKITFSLTLSEYEHLITTLEGAHEEFEVLMSDVSWYTTELTERIHTCLLMLESTQVDE